MHLAPRHSFIKGLDECLVKFIDISIFKALQSFLRKVWQPAITTNMLFQSITLATLISAAVAQSPAYGQCGGQGWTGSQSCVSGYACKAQSEYYSQCLPGSGKISPSHHENITDCLARRKQPNNHSENHHQVHIISASHQHWRFLIWR